MKSSIISSTMLVAGIAIVIMTGAAHSAEWHVSVKGADTNAGALNSPFLTIQRAADVAQPGDTITVYEGVYREQVAPPRGGTSDDMRITYQNAPGQKAVITGSEIVKGWEKVDNDTWKVVIPNKFFGEFNPYSDQITGDWFISKRRQHHTGAVYLNGHWLIEAATQGQVLAPCSSQPVWFSQVEGAGDTYHLVNLAYMTVGDQRIPAVSFATKSGELCSAEYSEGGQCIGWVREGNWLKFDKVNFGAGLETLLFRAASVSGGGDIEIRLDSVEGELLGRCVVTDTGSWQKWADFSVKIKPTSGQKDIVLVFRPRIYDTSNTTIWAQFPGVNPNDTDVEVNVRKTVFSPKTTGVDYITLRGFKLRNAATPWAPPTAAQWGLVSAHWCKGWIIESNDIA
ncbi:MAG: carbohydrate-binding protein, partial [bacterium]|nr:carbohydrate-binding protein [bacterium]